MQRQNSNPLDVVRIVYKEIKSGDTKKQSETSNRADSGGGARDLRLRPHKRFLRVFERMFPQRATLDGKAVQQGAFSWRDHPDTMAIVFREDTKARPGELRIGRINKAFPQEAWPQGGDDVLLMLIQRADGAVWPYFTTVESLRSGGWHPAVSGPILRAFDQKNRGATAGYIDYEFREEYNNGK